MCQGDTPRKRIWFSAGSKNRHPSASHFPSPRFVMQLGRHQGHQGAVKWAPGSLEVSSPSDAVRCFLKWGMTRVVDLQQLQIFLDKDGQDGLLEQKRHPFISIRWIFPAHVQAVQQQQFPLLALRKFHLSQRLNWLCFSDVFPVGHPTFEEITLWWTNIAMENHHF